MRFRFVLAVPLLALLACTGSEDGGAASSTPPPAQHAHSKPAGSGHGTAPTRPRNWVTYHLNRERSGYDYTMPTAVGAPTVLHRYHLDGNVYASPLIIRGRAIVATENNTVYAVQSGHVVWSKHLGAPVPGSQLPCGNIDPLGITGTPVFHHGTIYVAPEFAGSPPRHELYALRFSDGQVRWHRNLDLPGVDPAAMQERGALTFAGGRVWVPFGGLFGDCGAYKGRLIGVPYSGAGQLAAFTVPTTREAGIWAPPGPVWIGQRLFLQVGNGEASFGDPYDKSDSVLALNTDARVVQFFAPDTWRADNAADLDLGSTGPTVVGNRIFAVGKRGRAYVLHRRHLGGIGAEMASLDLCASFGGTAVEGFKVYVPCTDGIRAVRIDPETGHMRVAWHASSAVSGSPVVGGLRVWALGADSGTLYALNSRDGHIVNSVNVGVTSRFATPAIYGSRVYVPTLDGLTVVATS
jgi:outer membrane protein assembly factor BamB